MDKTREIIEIYLAKFSEFEYYFLLIDKIEANVNSNPDIAIESSKSLIEGISKTILLSLDKTQTEKKLNAKDFPELFRDTLKKIQTYIDIEEDFLLRSNGLISRLAELRNKRGDISHGRLAPKKENSTIATSKFIMHVTDAICSYILETYFNIDFQTGVIYDDYPEFNEQLDGEYDINGLRYSKALFDQDRIQYIELLKNHLSEIE